MGKPVRMLMFAVLIYKLGGTFSAPPARANPKLGNVSFQRLFEASFLFIENRLPIKSPTMIGQ